MSNKIIFALVLTLLLTTVGSAATVNVAATFADVNTAITNASSGDEIVVANGTVTLTTGQYLDTKGKAITVRSANGASNCTINCQGVTRAFLCENFEDQTTVIDGFTIKNGIADYGAGIECYFASPTIENCIIESCSADDGGAIDIFYGSPLIKDCVIRSNTSHFDGSAIECAGEDSMPVIQNCLFYGNTAMNGYAALDFYDGCTAEITNCTIANNTGKNTYGGIQSADSTVTVKNSILWSNGISTTGDTITITYSCLKGAAGGTGNIASDPMFRTGFYGNYYLSQKSAGQLKDSNCVNAGDVNAVNIFSTGIYTTNTYDISDTNKVDLGYHYKKSGVQKQYLLFTKAEPAGLGTVDPCLPSGQLYHKYAEVTVEANASSGHLFSEWHVANKQTYDSLGTYTTIPGPNSLYNLTIDQNMIVIAKFNSNEMRQLKRFVKAGYGSISVSPNLYPDLSDPCIYNIPKNSTATVTASPSIGYVGKNWYIGDSNVFDINDANTYNILPPTTNPQLIVMDANKTVAVEFKYQQYKLTTSVTGGNGSIAPKRGMYDAGTTITLTATPDAGYRVHEWFVDTVAKNKWNVPTLDVVIDANKNVNVIFEVSTNRVISFTGSSPYTTLQDAINAANNGDTIVIAPGTYPASGTASPVGININKSITILGNPEHPEQVVIDGNNFTNRAFYLDGRGGAQVTLNGITIANVEYQTPTPVDAPDDWNAADPRNDGSSGNNSYGAGIFMMGDHTISNCVIKNCIARGGSARDGSAGNIYNISEHKLPVHKGGFGGRGGHAKGAGIYIASGSPIIKNTIVKDCNALGGIGGNGGAGLAASTASPIDPNFPGGPGGNGGNGGDAMGAGIFCEPNTSPTFIACTVENCQARSGYGGDGGNGGASTADVNAWDPCDPTIFIQHGDGQGGHGGMPGLAYGGGVYVDDDCHAKFVNCKIIENAAKSNVAGCGGNSGGNASIGIYYEGGLGGLVDLDTLNIAIALAIGDASSSSIVGFDPNNLILPTQIFINGTPTAGMMTSALYSMIYPVSPDVYTAKGGGVFIGGYDTFFGRTITAPTTADFNNCQISGNWTKGSTSGMGGYNTDGLIIFYNSSFAYPSRHYRIPSFGNGLYLSDDSNTTFTNSTVEDNFYTMENTTNIYALANDYYIDASGNPIAGHPTTELESPRTYNPPYTYALMYLDIYGEDYLSYGGGLCFDSWTLNTKTNIKNCNITTNDGADGGGIYANASTLYVADSNLSNNLSYSGGAVMAVDSNGLVHNTLIKNNTAGTTRDSNSLSALAYFGTGGGIYAFSSRLDINDCTITDNTANSTGGGLCIEGDYWKKPLLKPLVKNNLIKNNVSGDAGGGIAVKTYAQPTIQNCTITKNNVTGANGSGGGIFASYSANVTTSDNIIWANTGILGSQIALSSGGPYTDHPASMKVSYSDIDLKATSGLDASSSSSTSTASLLADRLVEPSTIYNEINTNGTAKVIVTLADIDFDTDWSSSASVSMTQNAIAYRQAKVLSALDSSEFTLRHQMKNAAVFSGSITAAGLTSLLNNSLVAHIEPVRTVSPMLAQAIPMGNALATRSQYNGQNCSIAIVDSGVDYTHPRLGGGSFPNSKVIGGYDTGDNDADPMPMSDAHGTCCAGIAAGNLGTVGDYIGGVAYGAKIYALKFGAGQTDKLSNDAGLAAWDWCLTHKNDNTSYPIRVISNSWGIYELPFDTTEAADALFPAFTAMAKKVVDAGITLLAASGNDGFAGQGISWPSAMSNVISVGAVYDTTGKVTDYSNTANNLDIFAPADPVYTTDIVGTGGYDTGDYYPYFNGTSSATPFAAGCVAALQSAAIASNGSPLSPAQVEYLLKATGKPVTDTKVNITKPMVNLASAIALLSSSTPIYIDDANCSFTGIAKDTSDNWTVQGSTNISADPNFVIGFYLSNTEAGQNITSVCVDAGSVLAGTLNLDTYTTRTDGVKDTGYVDMGYHYGKGLDVYNLVIDVNTSDANGTTNPRPGTHKKYAGDTVIITAIPDVNSRVAAWIIDGTSIASNVKKYTITMNRAHTVTVVFEKYAARSIVVPDQYKTIKEAIDAAESGDIIYIYPKSDGKPHYIEDPCGLDFGGKSLTIRSRFPDDQNIVAETIIDCNNRGRAFIFRNGEDANSIVEGLTIINGMSSGPIAVGTQVVRNPVDANIYQLDGIDATGDGYGGAIYVGKGTSPTISKCVFTNCQVTGGQGSDGGNGYSISSTSTLTRGGFGGNGGNGSGNGYGGVIYCAKTSAPSILNCKFNDNAAHGGVGGDGGNGGNGASGKTAGNGGNGGDGYGNGYGGVIYCSTKSSPKIISCKFSKNLGGMGIGGGPGVQGQGQTPTQAPYPYDGYAGSASGTGFGGAIYYEKGSNADINDCQILDGDTVASTGDTLGSGGGAIYFEPACANSIILNSTLAGNKASAGLGGAIILGAKNKLVLNNCYLGGNSANTDGGAIAVGSAKDANLCKLVFNDCVFTSNTASAYGGSIYAKNTDANFVECFVNRNTAYSGGGIYFVSKSSLRFIGGTINDNNAVGSEAQGGGAAIMHLPAEFVNCQVTGNSSNYAGGGIMFNGPETADSNVINCLFAKNRAAVRGGAIVTSLDSSPVIRNCTFSENEAAVGGKGGAIFCTFRSSPTLKYNIFDKNKRIAIYENSADCAPVISYNFFKGNSHGEYYKFITPRLFSIKKPAIDKSSELSDLNADTAGNNDADLESDAEQTTIFRTGSLGDYYLKQKTKDYNDTACKAIDAGGIAASGVTVFDGKTMADYTTRTDSYLPDSSSDTYDSNDLDLGFHYKDANEAAQLYLTTVVEGGKGTISPASGYVYRGMTVQLTASPTTGWRVKQWSGTDDDSTTNKTNYVVMMSDRTVSLTFEQPRNLYLPAGYATLQEAINDSRDGDKIIIAPGTYQYYDINYDNLFGVDIDGKSITITSTNPDDPCVVAATIFKGNRFVIANVDSSMILDGITIQSSHWMGSNGRCPTTPISPDGVNGFGLLGGAMEINNASPTIRNVRFVDCSSGGGDATNNCGTGGDGGWAGFGYGGAVGIDSGSSPVFKNCQFIGCYAYGGNGGDGDTSTETPGHGGTWGDPNGNAYVTWDYADGRGGDGSYAPYWYYTGQGGAIYCSADTHPVFQNCVFSNNFVVGGTCGVSCPNVEAWPNHHYVIDSFGGAVYMAAGSQANFTGCSFADNFGDTRNQIGDANATWMYTESDWALSDNVVSYGGAIYAESADSIPTIKDCTFSNNTACAGGALDFEDSVFHISDSNFFGNTAMLGGSMLFIGSNSILSECDFFGNSAVAPAGQGGVVYSAASAPKFYDSRMLYNSASSSGGAGYFSGELEPNMHNCLIAHNIASTYGGGISANFDVQLHLSSCTLAHNQATGSKSFGGGLNCAYNANTTVLNSIFWENEAQTGRQIAIGNSYSAADKQPAEVTVTYSNIQGGGAGIFCDQANGCLLYGFSEPSTNLYGTSLSSPQFVSSLWVTTPWNGYFLAAPDINEGSATMQTTDNMCIDSGSATAKSFNMYKHTTRTDRKIDVPDSNIDMGYHYIRPETITGDFDFDGDVDIADLTLFLEKWMYDNCTFPYYCDGRDFTEDGEVDFEDYAIFAEYYQETEEIPPQPNPMTWAISPKSAGETSITMTATTATDNSSNVIMYEFQCTYPVVSTARDWEPNSTFTAVGLTTGNTYGYRVRAKDGRGNMTGWSVVGYAKAGSDSIAPTPNPMTWLVVPALIDSNTVGMSATIATDNVAGTGVEYSFEETTGHKGGTNSGWISVNTYIDYGLEPNTVYTYKVKARDKSDNYNETGYSVERSVITPASGGDVNDTNDISTIIPVWATDPYVTGGSPWYYHVMDATAATDAVAYYFDCCEGAGTDSGWIPSTHYQAGPFGSVTNSSYRYKYKNASGQESGWSPIVNTYKEY